MDFDPCLFGILKDDVGRCIPNDSCYMMHVTLKVGVRENNTIIPMIHQDKNYNLLCYMYPSTQGK